MMSKIIRRGRFLYGDNNEFLGYQHAIVECCGEEIYCGGFTNTCRHCGADFDSNGHQLAPRSQWGEETGESIEDILSVDNYSTEQLLEGY